MKKPVDIQTLINANNSFRARNVSRAATQIEADLLAKQLERRLSSKDCEWRT